MTAPASVAIPAGSSALKASFWALVGEAGTYVVRLGSNLILTRLVDREAFGIMVLLTVCIIGLTMLSDLGFRSIIVQHRRGDDPDFVDTAWTIQVIRGFLLSLFGALIAWPLARIYDQPSILVFLPVLALTAAIDGLTSTRIYTLDRHLAQGKLSAISLGSAVFTAVVTIAWASRWPGAWALIAGTVAGSLLRTALSHFALPGRANRFRWEPEACRELVRFGRWITVSSLFTFLAMQTDRLVFGKMITMAELGVYGIGAMFARLPVELLLKLVSSVGLPLLSRSHQEGKGFQETFRRFRLPFLTAGGATLGALILGGPALIRLLYDDRYLDAGWILQIVAVAAWFQVLECSNAVALLAKGEPKWIAAGNVLKVVLLAVALPVGFRLYGFPGALVAVTAIELPRYLLVAAATRKAGAHGWRIEAILSAGLLASGALAAVIHARGATLGPAGPVAAASAAVFAALWLPLVLGSWKRWRTAS